MRRVFMTLMRGFTGMRQVFMTLMRGPRGLRQVFMTLILGLRGLRQVFMTLMRGSRTLRQVFMTASTPISRRLQPFWGQPPRFATVWLVTSGRLADLPPSGGFQAPPDGFAAVCAVPRRRPADLPPSGGFLAPPDGSVAVWPVRRRCPTLLSTNSTATIGWSFQAALRRSGKGSPDLTRYTHRVAIANDRLVAIDNDQVVSDLASSSSSIAELREGLPWRLRSRYTRPR